MIQGQIEYYSYKPIAVGQELKIYYGLKYFTDLGYDPTPDKDNKGQYDNTVWWRKVQQNAKLEISLRNYPN